MPSITKMHGNTNIKKN